MDSNLKLKIQLTDTYAKTLELAKSISINRYQFFDDDIHKDHIRFIKNVSKGVKDFRDLDESYTIKKRKPKTNDFFKTEEKLALKQPQKAVSKLSGKLNLTEMIDESYQLACITRTGKGGIRHLTPSPPPIVEKLRNNNKSMYTETSDSEEKPLAYFSLINGKTEEIELPSFRDCIKGNKRIDSQSEIALQKIEKCQKKIGNFEKEINGLEIFCKYNPGVPCNLDKKFLLRLGSNPVNKMSLLKAYNERNIASSSEESKNLRGLRNKHLNIKKNNTIEMPLIEEKRSASTIEKYFNKDSSLISNCFDAFRQAKINANSKIVQILAKLKAERPIYLRKKANLILADHEKYKGRIHSFQTLEKFKKSVEKERYLNVMKSKSQIGIYTKLLDYLKRSKGMPTQSQISFVEAVRELLEGGWSMSTENLDGLLNTYSEYEKDELKDLVKILHEFLENRIFLTMDYN